jgi:hypothetical protein
MGATLPMLVLLIACWLSLPLDIVTTQDGATWLRLR